MATKPKDWDGPRVVGQDKRVIKRITCRNCAAIVEYVAADVKSRSYTCMGDASGHSEVKCPKCKQGIEIPGTSW